MHHGTTSTIPADPVPLGLSNPLAANLKRWHQRVHGIQPTKTAAAAALTLNTARRLLTGGPSG
jgi:hypothetical protein